MSAPMRFPAPTTGNPDHDLRLCLLARAILLGHTQLAFERGWRACMESRPMPDNEHEVAGFMAAFHELTYAETGDTDIIDHAA